MGCLGDWGSLGTAEGKGGDEAGGAGGGWRGDVNRDMSYQYEGGKLERETEEKRGRRRRRRRGEKSQQKKTDKRRKRREHKTK